MNLERNWRHFVQSGCVLAASASGIVIANSIIYQVPLDILLVVLAFLLTFASYHINRVAEIEQDIISNPERTRFIQKYRLLDKLAVLSLIIVGIISLTRNFQTFILVLIPPVSVIVYSFKLLPGIGRLKDILFVKNIFVAAAWTTYMFITATYFNIDFTPAVWAMALYFFMRFFINTVVFDIRDVVGDKIHEIKTVPVKYGEYFTRNLLLLVNTISGVFLFSAVELGWLPYFAHALNFITFYGYAYIILATDEKVNKHALCDIIVDGEFLLWPILLLVGKILLH